MNNEHASLTNWFISSGVISSYAPISEEKRNVGQNLIDNGKPRASFELW